ncbi:cell wall protein PhiA [Lentithecium fluviatile CBS 122367]|uniref:Cell wall protein PhiA n=1 Tax=Lentithecium fluviatile CBS 122367 TaxID=1168545 RepID=A0A6G1J529_9PLEO|nr:cell wall protein PhiA [Lentithecium fluviatile CBS 122367]
MQFTTAFLASAAALTASALPQSIVTPIPADAKFGVITIRSGSPIHNQALQAARNSLLVGAKSQNASCDADTNFATFYINDEELFLYAASATPQTIFVDRSGMGMGKIGYVTGAEPLGRNWETRGWAIGANNELQFDGTGIQACPGAIDGSWSIWLQGLEKPGWNENCTTVAGTAIKTDNPIGCLYTQ